MNFLKEKAAYAVVPRLIQVVHVVVAGKGSFSVATVLNGKVSGGSVEGDHSLVEDQAGASHVAAHEDGAFPSGGFPGNVDGAGLYVAGWEEGYASATGTIIAVTIEYQ